MTKRLISPAVFAVAALLTVAPLSAAVKRRAVSMPKASQNVTLSGQVTDATTNGPVAKAMVNAAGKSVAADASGRFSLEMPSGRSVALTISRSGYQTLTTAVTLTGDMTKNFSLTPNPSVTVKTKAGTTYQLDLDTVEFGYLAPFSGFSKDVKMNLCKPGGESFTPDRSEIKRLAPAASLTDTACCKSGAVAAVDVELKTGQKVTAALTDACFGYQVDIIGLRHDTADPINLHLADLTEIVFP